MSKRYFYFEMEGVEMKKFKSLKIRDMCHKKEKKKRKKHERWSNELKTFSKVTASSGVGWKFL